MNNLKSLSLQSLTLLIKQYLIQNGKMFLVSVAVFIAGVFVVLYSIQRYTRFDTWTHQNFMTVFIPVFIVLAVLYAGTSFPGLRSKDRAIQYLMLPVSTKQKFFTELFARIALFVILMPTLFWVSFYVEGQLVALVHPEFTFKSFSFLDGFNQNNLVMTFVISHAMLFLTFPFFGATVFMKNQIIKTVAWGFALLFGFFILFHDLIPNIPKQHMQEFTVFIILLNIAMVVLAYFNIKRKQV